MARTYPALGPWGTFFFWLHHNITAGLKRATVYMVDGRLVVEEDENP